MFSMDGASMSMSLNAFSTVRPILSSQSIRYSEMAFGSFGPAYSDSKRSHVATSLRICP